MHTRPQPTAPSWPWLLLIMSLSVSLLGFATLFSDQTRWRSTPTYSIQGQLRGLSAQDVLGDVRAAFTTWSSIQGGGLNINEVSSGASIPVALLQSWPQEFGENAAGVTLPYRSGDRITSAEVYINDQHFSWSTTPNPPSDQVHLEAVVLHEVGHAIGFSHSFYFDATMYWSAAGDDRHTLHEDDLRGFRYLYGGVTSGRMCDTCLNNNECLSGQCFDFGGVTACGASCGPAPSYLCSDAPDDRAGCFELQSGAESCLPLALTCSDEAVEVVEEGGYCFGAQHCASDQVCEVSAEGARCVRLGSGRPGDPCAYNDVCESGICLPLSDSYAICVTACDPQNPRCDGECVGVTAPDLNGVCVPSGDVPSGGACDGVSQRCQRGLECESGRCTSYCDPYGDCPGDLACTPVAGRWRCEPTTGPQEGAPCVDNRCAGGLFCLQSQQVCVAPCDPNDTSSCGGHACVELSAIGICSPGDLGGGAPCQEDIECLDFSCVALPDGGAACAPLCELGCPEGWECPATPVGERPYCVPSPPLSPPSDPDPSGGTPAINVDPPPPMAGQATPPAQMEQPLPMDEEALSGEASPQSSGGLSCQASHSGSRGPLPLLVFCLLATYGVQQRRTRALTSHGGSR